MTGYDEDAWVGPRRWLWILPAALALSSGAALASDFSVERRVGGSALALLLSVAHVLVGPRVMCRNPQDRGFAYVVFLLLASAILFAIHPGFFFILYGVYPLCFVAVSEQRQQFFAVGLLAVISGIGIAGWDGWTKEAWLTSIAESGISFLFAIVVGTWIARIIEQSKERRAMIAELESTRAALAVANRTAGVVAERERLASEIHDTLAQGFTSLLMLVQAADASLESASISDFVGLPNNTDARRLLELAAVAARENLAEARSLVGALQPVDLQSSSVADAVRRVAKRFEDETGIVTTVAIVGPPRLLAPADDVVLLRATQEALTNVRRHAEATLVEVTLDFGEVASNDHRAMLAVVDNGRGFSPLTGQTVNSDKFGIAGMRRRAEQVGGWVDVHSTVNGGTRLRLVLP